VDATTVFIVGLFLLVGCAVLAGEVASRLGQAALVGQLLVGVVLGPTLLGPVLGLTGISTELSGIEILATFFVLMTAGLAITPEQIASGGWPAGAYGVAIFAGPFVVGSFVVHLLYPSMGGTAALFVALTISITALPVLGVILYELDLLKSRFGTYLVNGSLVNELAAVTTFSVLLRVEGSGSSSGELVATAIAVVTVAVFLSSILAAHSVMRMLRELELWDRLVSRVRTEWRSREAGFALLMVGGLAAALYSQWIGLTFLVGAFYAGLLVTPASIGVRQHRQISRVFDAVTWGFFIPLFFALVGFSMDLRSLVASPEAIAAFAGLCAFALASKVVVGSGVSRLLGWSRRESIGSGFLVASRGAVELAMATILLASGVFSSSTFTIVAGVGLVTTLLCPIGARRFVKGPGTPSHGPVDDRLHPWLETSLPLPAEGNGEGPGR
jgi:Kef-type K+ transport system membrane component KefB